MMRATSPFANSLIMLTRAGVQEPSSEAMPSHVAERTNLFLSTMPPSELVSNIGDFIGPFLSRATFFPAREFPAHKAPICYSV